VGRVHERQTLGGLDHTKDELAREATGLLGHAEGADVVINLALTVEAPGREVGEDDGQIPVDQRPDLPGQPRFDGAGRIHQGRHRAQGAGG
jgi:hypothetical protein